MTIKWGDPIECNGVRPDWLRDDEPAEIENAPGEWLEWSGCVWHHYVTAIRLPAGHPAYVALARGFKPWSGGENAPDDWDGGECLARNGDTFKPDHWTHPWNVSGDGYATGDPEAYDVIGYRKRAVHTDGSRPRNLTEAEVRAIVGGFDAANRMVGALATRGLIRPETTAERFTRETGHAVTEAVEAALNWKGE